MPIPFHLDAHISAGVAAALRRRNIDVTTVADAGLTGATDTAHIEFANPSGHVIVTQDNEFLRLHAQGVNHAGTAYRHQQSLSAEETPRRVVLIHDLLSSEEIAGRVEFP